MNPNEISFPSNEESDTTSASQGSLLSTMDPSDIPASEALCQVRMFFSNDFPTCLVFKSITKVIVFLQIYRGKICTNFVGNKTVYIPPGMTQKMLEIKLNTAFMVVTHST